MTNICSAGDGQGEVNSVRGEQDKRPSEGESARSAKLGTLFCALTPDLFKVHTYGVPYWEVPYSTFTPVKSRKYQLQSNRMSINGAMWNIPAWSHVYT